MTVHAYKLVNRSENALLLERVAEVFRLFIARVAVDERDAHCVLTTLDEAECSTLRQYEWIIGRRAGEPWLGIGVAADAARGLARMMLGDAQSVALNADGITAVRELASGLIENFGENVIDSLCGAAAEDNDVIHWDREGAMPGRVAAGEAFVAAECQLGNRMRLKLLLWPRMVLNSLATAPVPQRQAAPLESLRRAIQSEGVTLDVIVGEAEMAVHDLATLKIGDVIKLDRKLEQPLQIQVRDGKSVGMAYLGTQNGHAAMQFAAGR